MKNNILKTLAILLSFASIITVFAACSKKDDGSLVFKDKGKIYYRADPDDSPKELATDANGVTLVDEQGNLLLNIVDDEGVQHTHPVSFPEFVKEGKKISCQQFTITVPRGWENIGNTKIMLRNSKEGLQMDYSFFDADEGNNEEKVVSDLENFLKFTVESGEATVSKEDINIAGRDGTKLIFDYHGDEPAYSEFIIVPVSTGVLMFTCVTPYEEKGDFEFKSILDTLEYRV